MRLTERFAYLQPAKTNVLSQYWIYKLVNTLPLCYPFKDRAELTINEAGNQLVDELNIHFFRDLPSVFEEYPTHLI